MKIAFVGLGVMGFPMAGHLAQAGHSVTVYNRTTPKSIAWCAEFARASGSKHAETPALAAQGADIVFCCVGNDDDLRSVTLGADGAFAGMAAGAVFVDHTTASASVARELHALAQERGLHFIDAPVSGGQAGAQNGMLTVMCGGDAAAFDTVAPVGSAFSKAFTRMGPSGAGQLTKMVNQICIAGLVQGVRDTLFNLNEGYANYRCLKAQGGDVRLLTTQTGHNTLQVTPDLDQIIFHPTDLTNTRCGTVDPAAGALAFFNEHLKGVAGAANAVPKLICLSIAGKDAVLVNDLTVGRAGTQVAVPRSSVVAGLPEVANAVPLGIVGAAGGTVVAGIPHIDVTVSAAGPGLAGQPVIFAGIGIQHNPLLPVYELIDNQVTPLKGLGRHDVNLTGIAARLQRGQKLVLLLYGGKDQYLVTGSTSLNLPKTSLQPLTVSGTAWMPVLGQPPTTAP